MTHKCEYCDKILLPCKIQAWIDANPDKEYTGLDENYLNCKFKGQENHLCCTCDKDESLCEVSPNVVCDGPLCQFKFQVYYLETELEKLKGQEKEAIASLKELSNSNRILGISPKALEIIIQKEGFNIPTIMFVKHNERFTWDLMKPDDLVTVGLAFMRNYETLAKQWAAFLNEKSVKVNIKKELIDQSSKKVKEAQKSRNDNGTEKEKPKPRVSAKLNDFEKIVLHNMRSMNITMAQAIEFARSMGAAGEIRPETKFE